MEISVGKLAARFGISRSTLLYYESINLLEPSARNEAGYRLYCEADVERLSKIMILKEAGVPLAEISNLLNAAKVEVTALLLKRLGELNKQIEGIKKQQNIIIKLLENSIVYKNIKTIDEDTWLAIMNLAGIKKETAQEWHSQFEKQSPMQHQNLLELLGFDEREISQQREHYRNMNNNQN